MLKRNYTLTDYLCCHFDKGLRTLTSSEVASRPNPAAHLTQRYSLSTKQQKYSAGFMRVNHTGEVCAQALYQGQALTARTEETKRAMQTAADEEIDHLAWCRERLQDLQSHTSYLNPLWYVGSLSLGVFAGLIGERWNLGFVAETERQVVKHLEGHLVLLPSEDEKSRAIIEQMIIDESAHADMAVRVGAAELPQQIKALMHWSAKFMTKTVYWV